MTFPEIDENKDHFWERICAVDNVRTRRKSKFHLKGVFVIP
jgi:hypothetical protein